MRSEITLEGGSLTVCLRGKFTTPGCGYEISKNTYGALSGLPTSRRQKAEPESISTR